MSFLTEVMNIVSKSEISNARATLKTLLQEIRSFQEETQQYIKSSYSEFDDNVGDNERLLCQAEHLCREVENVLDNIQADAKGDLLSIDTDVQHYLVELNELRVGTRLNRCILRIDELFSRLDENGGENLPDMRTILNELHELIFANEDNEVFKECECYKPMKIRWYIENETLLNKLRERFDAIVQLGEKTYQSTKCITVKISKSTTAIQEIVPMLFETNYNVQRFSTFIMDNILEPIITRPVSFDVSDNADPEVTTTQRPSDEFVSLTVSFSTKTMNESTLLRPDYKLVFQQLLRVMKLLAPLNVENHSVYQLLGEQIGEKCIKLLIDECLTYAIPETINALCSSSLVDDIQNFDAFLRDIEFQKDVERERKLIEFSEKIDVIFKKRFCMNILNSAVEIMHKDLHDMQIVEDGKDEMDFPRCMISRSTLELIEMMEKVTKISVSANVDTYVFEDIQERLRSTVPMILERYLTEVIDTQGKLLQTIPQQAALFHNNCMYLAWWLSRTDKPMPLDRSSSLISELQELGTDVFASQIKNQRSQMHDILKEFDFSDSIVELGPQPLKIVRQCLRQFDLLRNVWQTILPVLVYNKTMATILNDFCDEILAKILAREDIPSSIAIGLVNICDLIEERAATTFSDPHEIVIHVKHWTKLQQMKMILNASMAQIVEQWADGKGPLKLNFTAEDIRRMIRALFQNTDRRAKVLASI